MHLVNNIFENTINSKNTFQNLIIVAYLHYSILCINRVNYKLINIIITLKLNDVDIYFCTLEFVLWLYKYYRNFRVTLLQVGTMFPIIQTFVHCFCTIMICHNSFYNKYSKMQSFYIVIYGKERAHFKNKSSKMFIILKYNK